jgi:hypothetical protein
MNVNRRPSVISVWRVACVVGVSGLRRVLCTFASATRPLRLLFARATGLRSLPPSGSCRSHRVVSTLWILAVATLITCESSHAAAPLATLEYRVNGTGLQVSPAAVAVPKGIAGSVSITLTGGEAVQALGQGAYVEAYLRGPGFPEPRRLVSPGESTDVVSTS